MLIITYFRSLYLATVYKFKKKVLLFYGESCLQRKSKGLKFYSVAGKFLLIQNLEFWILRTSDKQNRRRFPLKTGFHYAKFTFKAGLTVFIIVHSMSGGLVYCD